MSHVKTTDQRMQPQVDMANAIIERIIRYMARRHKDDPHPDFSNAIVQLGYEQRNAVGYCAQALPIVGGPGAPFTELYGIRVAWVHESSHCLIVEDAERRERITHPSLCDCQYKLEA